MAQKYLKVGTTNLEEVEGLVASSGAGDAGKIIAADATGKLDATFLPVGVGADTKLIAASENLVAGDYVNIHDSSGEKVRKADASTITKKADGFVLENVTAPANATVYLGNKTNNQKSGLTVGAVYFLDAATPGGVTTTVPTTAGHIRQRLGKAISTTEIATEIGEPIIRA
ncbi:MAG: hypothetical protein IAE98_03820 [Candidatus Kapabacteria bacterium]|nr:hypothetical protein [Candidatus Kapabacteria bacterium]